MGPDDACHHCGLPLEGSPFVVVLQGLLDDHRLPLCARCQDLRREGQLPVDLLMQQWAFAHSGARAATTGEAESLLIQLDCLGCGASVSRAPALEGVEPVGSAPSTTRLPDGALMTECPACRRTNVLERRGGQLVAVRLW